jgi:hypothetical protein
MTIFNTINEVEEQLKQIETNSGKIEFLKQQQNLKRYALKKFLTVADITETKTGRISKGLYEFDDKLIELSLKHDEVLRFIEIELEYLEALPPHQTEIQTEQVTLTFTNNFDKITPAEIYEHFKAGLVQKQYLTEQELNEYLKAAFELKKIPETLFKIKDAPKKAAIEAIFYSYYKNVAGKIYGKQKEYAALLGDYFEGYKTTTVSSNFSKSVY